MPSQGLKVPAEPLAGWILSFCSRDAAWYREQLSGMFLATTVNLSVTGLPWDGEDAAAVGGFIAGYLAGLQSQWSAVPGPFWVMVASKIPPP
jgi:hypothetical protein